MSRTIFSSRIQALTALCSMASLVACGGHVDEVSSSDDLPATVTPQALFTSAMAAVAPLTAEAQHKALAHFRSTAAFEQLDRVVHDRGCSTGEQGFAQRVRGVLYATFPATCTNAGREASVILCESVTDERCRAESVVVVATPRGGHLDVETVELRDGKLQSEVVTPDIPNTVRGGIASQSQAASTAWGGQLCSVAGLIAGSIVGPWAIPLLQMLPIPGVDKLGGKFGSLGKFIGSIVGGAAGYKWGPDLCNFASTLLEGTGIGETIHGITDKFGSLINGLLGSVTSMFSGAQTGAATQSVPNDAAMFDQQASPAESQPANTNTAAPQDTSSAPSQNVGGLDYGDFAPQDPNA